MSTSFRAVLLWLFLPPVFLLLAACSTTPRVLGHGSEVAANPWALASADVPGAKAWHHYRLPNKKNSEFKYQLLDGRATMTASASSSASMLRRAMWIDAADLGNINFSWKVPGLIEQADFSIREFDDAPVRVILTFEGDRSKFSSKNAMLSELALLVTGHEMPYATLVYTWCNDCAELSIIQNPRTDRVRKFPLESGPAKLNRWLDYQRDIKLDFEKAFGEAPGALTSVSIMTDTDNTKSRARAYYGTLRFIPKPR